MDNAQIAQAFKTLADLLELQGADPFRVRSYQNVARTLESLTESLADLAQEGRLRQIKGVGESTAKKITEMLETGTLRALEEAREQFPPALLDVLEVPGMGPKRTKLVYEQLAVDSVTALEHAARQQKLRDLEGFGAKSEENVLRGIELYYQGRERALLGDVWSLAQEIADELRAVKGVTAASAAGSLRRGCETIGDIDILVSAKNGPAITKAFTALAQVQEVVAAGDTKATAYVAGNRQVDVRVVPPASWGAALMYFTGSKAHNIALRTRAVKDHQKLNEYGLFEVQNGREKRLAGKTEAEVYKALGLAYIEPELREEQGEIEAALKGTLPRLITLEDIHGDLHMHTVASDGHNTLEEMVDACAARGYAYMAISEHSKSLVIGNGLSVERLREEMRKIRELAEQRDDIAIFCSSETDILPDGSLDWPDEVLADLDVVMASVHSGFTRDVERMTKRVIRALETERIDVLCHPTGRLIGRREAYGLDIEAVIEAAAKTNTALELNCSPERLDLKDTHCHMAKEAGVKVCLGTDAHSTGMLDHILFGVLTARRGWLERSDVVNAMSVGEFRKWLQRRR